MIPERGKPGARSDWPLETGHDCIKDQPRTANGQRPTANRQPPTAATDLAAIWMLLPSLGSRERAMAEYGPVLRATWLRARGWATLFGVLLLDNGLADNPRQAKMGELTLHRIAKGPY